MKKVLLTAGICLFAGSVFAQMKNVNAAFNEAKMPKPNFGEARKSINEALRIRILRILQRLGMWQVLLKIRVLKAITIRLL